MRRQPAFSLSYAHQIMRPRIQAAFQPVPGVPRIMQDLIDRIGVSCGDVPAAPSDRLAALKTLIDAETGAGGTSH